jgi:uncharacterized protein YciI
VKAVLFYDNAEGVGDKLAQVFPQHRARLDAFHSRGELLRVGPFMAAKGGAMGIFRDRAAAEAFVKEDPFVLQGIVARYEIRDWREVFA